MAFIQMDFISQSLKRSVSVNVILPVEIADVGGKPTGIEQFKTLYLLHGMYNNNFDWVTRTSVLRYAIEHNLAVVMPSCENSFYLDKPYGVNYGEFVGKELVEITRKTFPLSTKREDTFIGGLSMGGYGALRNGLKYSDTFSHIVALSSAVDFDNLDTREYEENKFPNLAYFQSCFGDFEKIAETDKSLKYLVNKLIDEKKDIPKLYIACGYQDFLFEANERFAKFLKEKEVDFKYVLDDGIHEWSFWDKFIPKAMDWLPYDK